MTNTTDTESGRRSPDTGCVVDPEGTGEGSDPDIREVDEGSVRPLTGYDHSRLRNLVKSEIRMVKEETSGDSESQESSFYPNVDVKRTIPKTFLFFSLLEILWGVKSQEPCSIGEGFCNR